ncbi:MAG: calcium/sodium antiporter [Acidimicrobiales bacterium]|nr:calcium/sodium antiporter [Acidimicrobiales bacterium]
MTVLIALAISVAGIVLLTFAADAFVEGAAKLAVVFNVTPIVIGAVIVGFGTSAPEMLVSAVAARNGDGDLGIGNIIGSNTANLSLILGAAALLVPIAVAKDVLKREAIMATVGAVIFSMTLQGGGIKQWEGVVLFVLLVASLTWVIRSGNAPPIDEIVEEGEAVRARAEVVRTAAGLVGTVGGAWLLVRGATDLADEFGLSGGFVGVTLVAIGTSLPELVTTVAAARQGSTDLIVGNLLGSNLFNSLAVGGVVGVLGDGVIQDNSLATLDMGFMLVVCLGAFAAMWSRALFTRIEGSVLLAVFMAFLIVSYLNERADPIEALSRVFAL